MRIIEKNNTRAGRINNPLETFDFGIPKEHMLKVSGSITPLRGKKDFDALRDIYPDSY